MDKNVFVAIVLCAGIFLVWQQYYVKPYAEHQKKLQQQAQSQGSNGSSAPNAKGSDQKLPSLMSSSGQSGQTQAGQAQGQAHSRNVTDNVVKILGDENYSVSVSSLGGTVKEIKLPVYKGLKLTSVPALIGGGEQLELSAGSQEWSYLSKVPYVVREEGKNAQGLDQVILSYDDENVTIQRNYALNPKSYVLEHEIQLQFKKQPPSYLFLSLQANKEVSKEHNENERRELFYNKAGGQSKWEVSSVGELKEELGDGNWIGFSSRYFLKALVDKNSSAKPNFQAKPIENNLVAASLTYQVSGSTMRIPASLYFGPKDINVLKAVGNHLDMAVDFGWFTFFAYPLLQMLKWFFKYVHNYGVAIILLTVLVKLVTYPLTYKSMKSMKHMQRIQPQLQKLRERYKDDKERLNKEMLQLMRANGYNPMSGCFPILIQMPVFIALYNVLYGAIDLYGQPFFGWIHDLSAKDPYFVTPILLSLIMFLQQKLTPTTATDPAQQKMMLLMPVIFGVMMLWLPAGLTLYMLVNSVTSIIQQVVINRKIGVSPTVVPV